MPPLKVPAEKIGTALGLAEALSEATQNRMKQIIDQTSLPKVYFCRNRHAWKKAPVRGLTVYPRAFQLDRHPVQASRANRSLVRHRLHVTGRSTCVGFKTDGPDVAMQSSETLEGKSIHLHKHFVAHGRLSHGRRAELDF